MMESRETGRLILKLIPDSNAREQVMHYLQERFKTEDPEQMVAKMEKLPWVIGRRIPVTQGRKIVQDLQKLGARAAFVPNVADGDDPPRLVENAGPGETVFGPDGIKKSRKRLRLAFALGILLFAVGFLGWRAYYGFGEGSLPVEPARPRIDFTAYRPLSEPAPSVMEVAAQDMHSAFLCQYRLRPDMRFVLAFRLLAENFPRSFNASSKGSFRLGEILTNGKDLRIPLLQGEKQLAVVRMVLPVKFSDAMSALGQWISAIQSNSAIRPTNSSDESLHAGLAQADAAINIVDPRAVIGGLIGLEKLCRQMGPHPEILKSAARGYAMLIMTLQSDRMQYADEFAARAMGLLALAKHLAPENSVKDEEALLALSMGYNGHAADLFPNPGETLPFGGMIRACALQDLQAAVKCRFDKPDLLNSYLLARLHRQMGLRQKTEDLLAEMFNIWGPLYPFVSEMIASGELGAAKVLSQLYPMNIVADLEGALEFKTSDSRLVWSQRLKDISDNEDERYVSLSDFETSLGRWRPQAVDSGAGFLIDDVRIRNVFRALYADALSLRFDVLLNRWGVVDRAEKLVKALAVKASDHPLTASMRSKILVERGKRNEAKALCLDMIRRPEVSPTLVSVAYFSLTDEMDKIRQAPLMAFRLDGRPLFLWDMGAICYRAKNNDMAERYYATALQLNPCLYTVYRRLSGVRGNGAPLLAAVERFPFSFPLQETAGDYFSGCYDPALKQKALDCYERVELLAPNQRSVASKKAGVLRCMNRHAEAAQVLTQWLEKDDRKDLLTVAYKAKLANIYLDMKAPEKSLAVIEDQISTYKGDAMIAGAKTYEALGRKEQAEEVFKKALERYPTSHWTMADFAGFYWRQGQDENAAQMIAQGRKFGGQSAEWYMDQFDSCFADQTDARMIQAASLVIRSGAQGRETFDIALHCRNMGRLDAAYQILQMVETGPAEQFDKLVYIYDLIRRRDGRQAAGQVMQQMLSVGQRQGQGMLAIDLFRHGLYDAVLDVLNDPSSYPLMHAEFLWLQRLIAWQALEKQPADLEKIFRDHYEASVIKSLIDKFQVYNYYFHIGRFLMGMTSEDALLSKLKTAKQRCEFAYYLGLGRRLDSRIPEAANWYQICLETGLRENGEFHWAYSELERWQQLGVEYRCRLPEEHFMAYEH